MSTEHSSTMTLDEAIEHYGVMGMKWGVRKDEGSTKIKAPAGATKTTRGVVADHNRMTDSQFRRKYAVSKSRYAKRVAKGDPDRSGNAKAAAAEAKIKAKATPKVKTPKPNSADIKRARNELARNNRRIMRTEDALDEATPENRAAAQKAFDKALSDFENNPKRSVAVKMTLGEAAVSTVIFPPFGLAAIAATELRSRSIKKSQGN
jgi:hypothetical protein